MAGRGYRLTAMVSYYSYGLTKELEQNFQNLYSNLNQISMMKAIDICYKLFGQAVEERMRSAKSRDIAFFSDLVMKVFSQYRMKRLPRDFAGCYTGRAGEIPAFN